MKTSVLRGSCEVRLPRRNACALGSRELCSSPLPDESAGIRLHRSLGACPRLKQATGEAIACSTLTGVSYRTLSVSEQCAWSLHTLTVVVPLQNPERQHDARTA